MSEQEETAEAEDGASQERLHELSQQISLTFAASHCHTLFLVSLGCSRPASSTALSSCREMLWPWRPSNAAWEHRRPKQEAELRISRLPATGRVAGPGDLVVSATTPRAEHQPKAPCPDQWGSVSVLSRFHSSFPDHPFLFTCQTGLSSICQPTAPGRMLRSCRLQPCISCTITKGRVKPLRRG